jgi:hypothetical protein
MRGELMNKLVLILILSANVVFAADEYFQNRILFCLKKDVPALKIDYSKKELVTGNSNITRLLNKHGVIRIEKWLTSADESDIVGDINLAKIYRAEFASDKEWSELENIVEDFRIISDVHSADLEAVIKLAAPVEPYNPNDTYYNNQWYLEKIMADYAWGLWNPDTPGDSTILIGIVDSGVDYLHPDLAQAMYINPGEDVNGDGLITAIDSNDVDDDGNECVDDFMGWDFVGATESSGKNPDNNVRPPYAGTYQELSHGTHVTGIAAATTDNDLGIAGISFQSKIIATKHAYDDDLQEVHIYGGYDGVLYCAKMGAKIINCSWGGGYDFYGKIVVDDVTNNYHAIIVCAAGNDNLDNDTSPHYPSNYENTIAVAALSSSDKKASFSNYGKNSIDISAPGTSIYSTIHYGQGNYDSWPGTSMSSPIVAGSFALLKSWFPDSSREWLIDKLLSAADPIDDLNPSYSGELGSGRVNIYNAIASEIYPSLSIKQYNCNIIDNNGDGQLNPGESAGIELTIENKENWINAENVTAVLSSNSPNISFDDSTAEFGNIVSGDTAVNLPDDIVFQISEEAAIEPINITVTLKANDASSYPYNDEQVIEIVLSINQAGFPVLSSSVSIPVAIDNLLGDANKEIIAVSENNLYVFNYDGSIADGFPVDLDGYTIMAPIIADMDNDGQKEIVIANRGGLLKIIKKDGSILSNININETIYGDAAVANMDLDPELEIVFGTMSKNIHIVKSDSTELEGFPLAVSSNINEGVALADITGDNIPEMIFGTSDKKLHVMTASGDSLENFPIDLGVKIKQPPIIAQNGEKHVIIITTTDNRVMCINMDGMIEAEYGAGSTINSAPSLCDINKDNSTEIFFGTYDGKIHAINLTGDTLENFPVELEGSINTSPVFADFNNDENIEIVISTVSGKLYIITKDGGNYPNFPASFEGNLDGSPSISDIDNDGDLEIVVGGNSGLYVLDISGEKGAQKLWQTYLGSNRRTGYYQDVLTNINVNEQFLPSEFKLLQNCPNPFNPVTNIMFDVPAKASGKNIKLEVFNILGQKVITLFNGKAKVGRNTVQWNGLNESGKLVSSGIYIYCLRCGKILVSKRMLLIK